MFGRQETDTQGLRVRIGSIQRPVMWTWSQIRVWSEVGKPDITMEMKRDTTPKATVMREMLLEESQKWAIESEFPTSPVCAYQSLRQGCTSSCAATVELEVGGLKGALWGA
jgi:hypothetical protein